MDSDSKPVILRPCNAPSLERANARVWVETQTSERVHRIVSASKLD